MKARVVFCRGGCGEHWLYQRSITFPDGRRTSGGRPREWCDRCYPEHRRERKRVGAPNLMAPGVRAALETGGGRDA